MLLLLYIILLLSIILISTQVSAHDNKLQVHLVGHSHDDPGIIILLLLYIV